MCAALYGVWNRRFIRNITFVTMTMAIFATSIEQFDMNMWTLIYLLIVACMTKLRDVNVTVFILPILLLSFAPRSTGWLVVVLLFLLCVKSDTLPKDNML